MCLKPASASQRQTGPEQTERVRATYLRVLISTVGGDGGDFASIFADVTVKARRRIEKVLRVFVNALHFPLKTNVDNHRLLYFCIRLWRTLLQMFYFCSLHFFMRTGKESHGNTKSLINAETVE